MKENTNQNTRSEAVDTKPNMSSETQNILKQSSKLKDFLHNLNKIKIHACSPTLK